MLLSIKFTHSWTHKYNPPVSTLRLTDEHMHPPCHRPTQHLWQQGPNKYRALIQEHRPKSSLCQLEISE